MRCVGEVGLMVECVRERGTRVGSTGRVVKPGTCKESRGGVDWLGCIIPSMYWKDCVLGE